MTLSLLIGSLPGVLLGRRLVLGVPETILRLSLTLVLVFSGTKPL